MCGSKSLRSCSKLLDGFSVLTRPTGQPRMALVMMTCVVVLSLLFAGCARTVYVPNDEPVRIREEIENTPVWVRNAEGEWIAGRIDIPEGWYALPDPGPEP